MQNLLICRCEMKVSGIIYLSAIVAALPAPTLKCADAATLQRGRTAVSYDMFLPADATDENSAPSRYDEPVNTPKTADTSDSDSFIGSQTVDYNAEIARELFGPLPEEEEQIIKQDSNTSRVFVPLGKKVRIVLQEAPHARWYVECNEGIELAANTKEGTELELLFNAEDTGNTKIYLDYVDKSDNGIRVIASRYINVIIG